MSSPIDEIIAELEMARGHLSKFDNKKTKVCATRCRVHLQTVKKLCDTLRRRIGDDSKAIPVKPRGGKKAPEDVKDESSDSVEEKAPLSPPRLERQQAIGSDDIKKRVQIAIEAQACEDNGQTEPPPSPKKKRTPRKPKRVVV